GKLQEAEHAAVPAAVLGDLLHLHGVTRVQRRVVYLLREGRRGQERSEHDVGVERDRRDELAEILLRELVRRIRGQRRRGRQGLGRRWRLGLGRRRLGLRW